ncbi:hypothetical protein [Mucilaginibacter sp.]|uniref:hypothetical protein n=1 Tax=Mucilaginibacter sp. TaxID=1882438 RepID=UPI003D11A435
MTKTLATFLCVFLFAQAVRAQDANYWSSSYNPAGFLTPGAVIAFNRDSGVMFLNPALLAYNTKNTASINASIYQYGSINIKNGAGSGLDLKSTSASIIPQMISATLSLKGKHPFTIGYALTNNPVMSFRANQQRDATINVLDDSYSPGNEYFLGQYKNVNTINETAGIISGGFKASDHFAIGISAEGQIRKQDYDYDVSSRALYNTNSALLPQFSNVQESYTAGYYHVGIRFKGGIAYDNEKHHLGLTLSSPLLHIAGSGNLLSDNEISNLIMPHEADTVNLLTNSRQRNLKVNYKMPVSVALGYAFDYKGGQLYIVTEYFAKVGEYDILTPKNQSFIKGVDIGDDLLTPEFLKFKDARKAVTNFGIGASYLLKPDLMGYLSLHTDFNSISPSLYNINDDGYRSNTANYNIYHCQIGANFKKRKFNLRTGLLLSYGTTNKYLQTVNFDNPSEANYLSGNPGYTKASQFSVGLMLSYIHNL